MVLAYLLIASAPAIPYQVDLLVWFVLGCVAMLGLGGWLAWNIVRIRRWERQKEQEYRRREANYLKEIDDIKNRFFTNLTHEFRTPLTLILTPTEQLLAEAIDDRQRKRLVTIHRNAHQLLKLLNELLDISHLDVGKVIPHYTEGDLCTFVGQAVRTFYPAAEQRGLMLAYDCCLTGRYLFDGESTEKILRNLVGNALKFSEPGGQVTITLTAVSEGVRLTVADTGIGISPAKLPNIFDRFYQGDNSSTRPYPGTGIGLSLVSELVNMLNGRISVKSEVGRGTTFDLLLPFRAAQHTAIQPAVTQYMPTQQR